VIHKQQNKCFDSVVLNQMKVFTFYFFTKAQENPNLTPYQAAQELSPVLKRFTKILLLQ
jgi:hypothetical protein